MGISDLKTHCLKEIENLAADGIVLLKHGKPVARVLPAKNQKSEIIGSMKSSITISGNILNTGITWNAES